VKVIAHRSETRQDKNMFTF